MKEKHTNFHVKTCGAFINQKYPWLHFFVIVIAVARGVSR